MLCNYFFVTAVYYLSWLPFTSCCGAVPGNFLMWSPFIYCGVVCIVPFVDIAVDLVSFLIFCFFEFFFLLVVSSVQFIFCRDCRLVLVVHCSCFRVVLCSWLLVLTAVCSMTRPPFVSYYDRTVYVRDFAVDPIMFLFCPCVLVRVSPCLHPSNQTIQQHEPDQSHQKPKPHPKTHCPF